MRILLVDDHPVVRMSVALILTRQGHEIVGECDNGVDALSRVDALRPDVVVLDLDIPKLDGLAVIERLRIAGSKVLIMVHSGLTSTHYASRCLRAGAVAYVAKMDKPDEIGIALRAIANGKTYFPVKFLSSVHAVDQRRSDEELLDRLTQRELRVLRGFAQGKTNKAIAEEMLLSNKTISTYKSRLYEKLDVSSLLELIEFAKRNRLG